MFDMTAWDVAILLIAAYCRRGDLGPADANAAGRDCRAAASGRCLAGGSTACRRSGVTRVGRGGPSPHRVRPAVPKR